MALVVLLRGINVGGHRTFRPTALAEQLKHLGAVNIGAAGTFVIRRPVHAWQLRTQDQTASRAVWPRVMQVGLIADAEILIPDKCPAVARLEDSPGAAVLALCFDRGRAGRDILAGH